MLEDVHVVAIINFCVAALCDLRCDIALLHSWRFCAATEHKMVSDLVLEVSCGKAAQFFPQRLGSAEANL